MKYLHGHGRAKADDERDNYGFLLTMVDRVYETAYFLKIENPSMSDLDCFAEAELKCIEGKKRNYVDFVAYYEYQKRLALGSPGNEKTDYENAVRIYAKMVAYKFYQLRSQMRRQGSPLNDYAKAEYALSLAKYLERHGQEWRVPSVDTADKRDEYRYLLDVVNCIWEEAYFLKLNNPTMSDLDCFSTAERAWIDEKEIDRMAYSEYQERLASHLLGNEKTDYENAARNYRARNPNLHRVTRKIAQMCSIEMTRRRYTNRPLANWLVAEIIVKTTKQPLSNVERDAVTLIAIDNEIDHEERDRSGPYFS